MGKIVMEYLYEVQGYISFYVYVNSGKFSGETSFCMPEHDLREAIHELSKLYETLSGCYKMVETDSDDYISFDMIDLGHMIISGQVGGSHSDQFVKFKYETDQTELSMIISTLKSFIK